MRDTIENLDRAIAILRKIQTNGKLDSFDEDEDDITVGILNEAMILQIIDILSTMKKQAEATVEGQRRQNEEELKALVTRAGQTPRDETIL
jgi:hypothetical protein